MKKRFYKKFNLPFNKEARCSLQVIKGIGWHKATWITTRVGIGYPYMFNKVNAYLYTLIQQFLNCCTWLEVRLNRFIKSRIKELILMKSYKGSRHKDCLPVRGQRTRTNAGTQKRKKYYV